MLVYKIKQWTFTHVIKSLLLRFRILGWITVYMILGVYLNNQPTVLSLVYSQVQRPKIPRSGQWVHLQRLRGNAALNDSLFYNRCGVCFLCGTNGNFTYLILVLKRLSNKLSAKHHWYVWEPYPSSLNIKHTTQTALYVLYCMFYTQWGRKKL